MHYLVVIAHFVPAQRKPDLRTCRPEESFPAFPCATAPEGAKELPAMLAAASLLYSPLEPASSLELKMFRHLFGNLEYRQSADRAGTVKAQKGRQGHSTTSKPQIHVLPEGRGSTKRDLSPWRLWTR